MKTSEKIHGQLRQERGLTLIELLIGAAMLIAILIAALPVIDGAFTTEGGVEKAALSVGDARVFSERAGRDLRLTDQVYSASSTSLTVDTYVRRTACGSGVPSAETAPAIRCRVNYTCSGGSCTRQEGGAAPVTLVTGLSDDNVFSYSPNDSDPSFVGIKVVLPNQSNIGGDAITLQDGTALRNVR